MSQEIVEAPRVRRERAAFAAFVALLVAPLVAQGMWRPLAHTLGAVGQAGAVTGAALGVAVASAAAHARWPGRGPALAAGALVAVGAALGLGLGAAGGLALLGVAVALGLGLPALSSRLPAALDGIVGRNKLLTVIYVLMALLSIANTARVSVFMGDPARIDMQAVPGEAFLETHSCLSAYAQADALVREGVENLYDTRLWQDADGNPAVPEGSEDPYHPFILDYYAYPPPFLLIVTPLAPLAGDFAAQRALWFGGCALFFGACLWIVARWIDGRAAHRALLLAPLLLGGLPALITLQVGNFQPVTVAMAVAGMLAFERRRPALGGALLAFAIVSKVSPGVLGIVLLVQRRWREAAWTAGFGVLYLALSVATIGVDPMRDWVTYTLPRLGSGEAFAFMDDDPFSVITNLSPFGIPFKLAQLGVAVGDPWESGPVLARVFTAALIVLAVVAGRREGGRRHRAMIWMSLLVLGGMQSPFAPSYVGLALLWAITLMAVETRSVAGGVGLVALLLAVTVTLPGQVEAQTLQSFLQMGTCIGIPVWLIVRRPREEEVPGVDG